MTEPTRSYFVSQGTTRRASILSIVAGVSLFALVALFGLTAPAQAQLYAGTVTGVVSDQTGALIAKAEVTLVDAEKGFTFTAKSDDNGRYLFRSVPPGVYNLSVKAPGFKDQARRGIKVDVSQNVGADFAMPVVNAKETVTVSTAAPLLATEDAVTGQVVDRKFINDLPLNGRDVWNLAFLAPGVTEVDAACAGCSANNFISNGTRNATADILMDGVTTTNYEQNSGIRVDTYTPSVDAVEEFKVQESNFSAEYGFSGATIINMVTRSGTNSFHGSLFEFLRHYKMDANNWFSDQQGIPKQPLRRNDFGATIGGPIWKNKTFFFFDYQGTRITQLAGPSFYGVPSDLERQGDFGEVCTDQGGSFATSGVLTGECTDGQGNILYAGQLWDPYAGVYDPQVGGARRDPSAFIPFNNLAVYTSTVDANHPGNVNLVGTPYSLPTGPGNLIDSVASKLMKYFPEPNFSGAGSGPTINRVDAGSVKSNDNRWDLKIDHRFNQKNLLSAKYSHDYNTATSFNCFNNAADPCSSGPSNGGAHLFAINDTHTFNPTTLLAVSYGLSRGTYFYPGVAAAYPNVSPVDVLGEPQYMKDSGYNWFPAVAIGEYTSAGAYNIGGNPYSYARQGQETHHLIGTLSLVRGTHEFKIGGEGRMHRLDYTQPNYAPGGTFYFDQTGTANYDPTCQPTPTVQCLPLGGDGMASFLIGAQPNDCCGQYEIPNSVASQNFEFGGFVQDNWKKTEKLTLNLGLRYELVLPRTERRNELNWVNPKVQSPITLQNPITLTNGRLSGGEIFASSNDRHSYVPDYKNIQPRFGFAYRTFHNTVVRGGYGIYFSSWRGAVAGTSGVGQQGFDQLTNLVASLGGDGATPAARMSNPYPYGPIKPPGSSLGLLNDVGYTAYGPIRDVSNKVPYEQSWSFGLQHETKWNLVLDASYIGKKGTHLYFANAGTISHLGPEIEHYTPTQIADLNSFVDNPFIDPSLSNASQIIADPNNPLLVNPQLQKLQLMMAHPQFFGFAGDEPPIANSIYHALQVRAEKRFSNGLEFLATYTFSKSIDDASLTSTNSIYLGSFASLQNPNNPGGERSLSSFDIPHVLQFSYTYELPIGRGRWIGGGLNPVLNAIVGGWRTNGIWRFNSGRPIEPMLYGNLSQPLPTYGAQRPNLIGTPHRNGGKDSVWINQYFTTADGSDFLAQPAQYALGTAPRTLGKVRDPGAANADLSLFKEFGLGSIREGMRLEYRLETFNAFNHPQFCPPDVTFGGPIFGQIFYTCNAPREVQMALKVYW